MYSISICQPRQDLLHPDADPTERDTALQQVDNTLHEMFASIGIPDEHVQQFKDWDNFIQQTLAWGQLPMQAGLSLSVVTGDADTEILASVHPSVADTYQQEWPYIKEQFYVFTRAEDWWKGEPFFLVSDANSFLLSVLYRASANNEKIRTYGPKKRGRPSNPDKQVARSDKAERYQQWLADCAAYRDQLNVFKTAYESALQEYQRYKAQGAPKWIP